MKNKDEAEFNEMVIKGTKAWADVPNAAEWVDELRGTEPVRPNDTAWGTVREVDISMPNKFPTPYESVDLFIDENNFGDEEMTRKILIRFLDFISRED